MYVPTMIANSTIDTTMKISRGFIDSVFIMLRRRNHQILTMQNNVFTNNRETELC